MTYWRGSPRKGHAKDAEVELKDLLRAGGGGWNLQKMARKWSKIQWKVQDNGEKELEHM